MVTFNSNLGLIKIGVDLSVGKVNSCHLNCVLSWSIPTASLSSTVFVPLLRVFTPWKESCLAEQRKRSDDNEQQVSMPY